jgi:threonine synthase
VRQTGGRVLSVSEQQIADAKAIIGSDGIGCEPASATTVAGIKKLVAEGKIQSGQTVVAVLTGHILKDPDYVTKYHLGKLFEDGAGEERPIKGSFANHPVRVKADRQSIMQVLDQLQETG